MNKTTLTPELLVDDLAATISWYRDLLGFKEVTISPEQGTPVFARIKRGQAEIMLFRRSEFSQEIKAFQDIMVGGSFVLYITVEDIYSTWGTVKDKATVVQPLHSTDYGSTEFTIEDCNGYHLMFGS